MSATPGVQLRLAMDRATPAKAVRGGGPTGRPAPAGGVAHWIGAAEGGENGSWPPTGNTGADTGGGEPSGPVVGLGWLALTMWGDRSKLLQSLGELLGQLRMREVATRGYSCAWDVLSSSTVSISDQQGRAREVHVELTQEDCERLTGRRIYTLVRMASACERWKCSRLDLNYDDAPRTAEPRAVYEAFQKGQAVTHVVESSFWEGCERVLRAERDKFNGPTRSKGETAYIGSPAGERRLRVYDADKVHGSGGVRWELQARDHIATDYVKTLYALEGRPELDPAGWVRTFWAWVAGFVDFVDDASAVDIRYKQRLEWFDRLTGAQAKMRPSKRPPVEPSFARAVKLVCTQQAPGLSYLVREVEKSGYEGWAYLRGLVVQYGDCKLSRREARKRGRPAPINPRLFTGPIGGAVPCALGPNCELHGEHGSAKPGSRTEWGRAPVKSFPSWWAEQAGAAAVGVPS